MADKLPKPMIEDPHHVRETYADTIVNFEVRDGMFHFSFGVARQTNPHKPLTEGFKFEVVARMVVPPKCAIQLREAFVNAITVQPVSAGSESKN